MTQQKTSMHTAITTMQIITGMLFLTMFLFAIIAFVTIDNNFWTNLCEPAPKGYETTDHYYLIGTAVCIYETYSELPHDACIKKHYKTENHGMIPGLTTCPKENQT